MQDFNAKNPASAVCPNDTFAPRAVKFKVGCVRAFGFRFNGGDSRR